MNKKISLILVFVLGLSLLLTACKNKSGKTEPEPQSENKLTENSTSEIISSANNSTDNNSSEESSGETTTSEPASQVEYTETLICTLVSGVEQNYLLLADRSIDNSCIYQLGVKDIPILIDGETAEVSDLKNGMTLELLYSGMILESYPAIPADVIEIRATSPEIGEYGDLCGLYLKVLEDLWNEDTGLNYQIENIGIDLSAAPGNLTSSEKAAICYLFGQKLNLNSMLGTYQDFVDQGFINDKELYWENGLLFSISESSSLHETETPQMQSGGHNTLMFNASKWASGLGAIFYDDCIATWGEDGYWLDYEIGSFAIS
ncbi:MAG: hypothetical protein ACOX3H_08315 [Saccharofermentanales bacterium]